MTDLAKLADAVEAALLAWKDWNPDRDDAHACMLRSAVAAWYHARRAAFAAGCVECLLSREAVEAIREQQRLSERAAESDGTNEDLYEARDCAAHRACDLLAALLKEPT